MGVVGLAVPPVGGGAVSAGEVVEVEAVGGGGLVGAGGVLPPEAGAVVGVGELEDAGEDEGAGRLGDLVGDEVGDGHGRGVVDDGLAQGAQVFRSCVRRGGVGRRRVVEEEGFVNGDDVAGHGAVADQEGPGEEFFDAGHGVVFPSVSVGGHRTLSRCWTA